MFSSFKSLKKHLHGRLVPAIVTGIFTAIIAPLIVNYFTKKEPIIDASYAVMNTKPYRKDGLGQLNLDWDSNQKINRFELSVESIGSESVKNITVDVRAAKTNLFSTSVIVFDPPLLEKHTSARIESHEQIYFEMPELPINTDVFVGIDSAEPFDEKDVIISVVGSGKRWNAEKRPISLRRPRRLFGEIQTVTLAYSQEPVETAPPTEPKPTQRGIYLGGYDPVVLSTEIVQILQRVKIIDSDEAEQLRKIIGEFITGARLSIGAGGELRLGAGGVLRLGSVIDGTKVLKFDEELLNALIRKQIINQSEGQEILERSRKAGGVLINGYNVIRLKAEILNALVVKKLISFEVAQAALDKAKAPETGSK